MICGVFTIINTKNDKNLRYLESNFRIQVSTVVDDKPISKAIDFYSNKKFKDLHNYIYKKIILKNKRGLINGLSSTRRYVVRLINKNGMQSKSKTSYVDNTFNPMDIINSIHLSFLKDNNCIKIKENRFRIIINNCNSICSDKKSFTLVCIDEHSFVVDKIKKLLDKIIEKEEKNKVIFNEPTSKFSHRIYCGKLENTKLDNKIIIKHIWKCFSITLHDYSSSEVIDLMIERIKEQK